MVMQQSSHASESDIKITTNRTIRTGGTFKFFVPEGTSKVECFERCAREQIQHHMTASILHRGPSKDIASFTVMGMGRNVCMARPISGLDCAVVRLALVIKGTLSLMSVSGHLTTTVYV